MLGQSFHSQISGSLLVPCHLVVWPQVTTYFPTEEEGRDQPFSALGSVETRQLVACLLSSRHRAGHIPACYLIPSPHSTEYLGTHPVSTFASFLSDRFPISITVAKGPLTLASSNSLRAKSDCVEWCSSLKDKDPFNAHQWVLAASWLGISGKAFGTSLSSFPYFTFLPGMESSVGGRADILGPPGEADEDRSLTQRNHTAGLKRLSSWCHYISPQYLLLEFPRSVRKESLTWLDHHNQLLHDAQV